MQDRRASRPTSGCAALRPTSWPGSSATHPLRDDLGYGFDVPLLDGDHVTDDTGTGFVHTAPGHGREDFEIWTANARALAARGINTAIPYTVDADGALHRAGAGLHGKRVLTDKGEKGDANEAVIKALADAGSIIARGRLKHQYPHSWRSKKPVIFRNTPQWFIAMDKAIAAGIRTTKPARRGATHAAPARARRHPRRAGCRPQGENRITGMIESRPDWVISRQRAWGVPIAVFVRENGDGSAEILQDDARQARIADAFEQEGADAWYADGARERFLGSLANERVAEGRRHSRRLVRLRLDPRLRAGRPEAFPALAGIRRKRDGGADTVMYLEGSDQHRGWFHSSLLETCGTRGRAPYDVVLTHGFVLDENGRKMSKSLGNVVAPQDVIKQSGADILRMWVCASDYADDLRIGPEILKTTVETYRKLRNTLRWMLGNLAHFQPEDRVALDEMPELERLMLHRLAELDALVRQRLRDFDYKRIFAALNAFMTVDLSAFYFDIRKDALYCDPISSRDAQGLPDGARPAVPLHRDLARADAVASRPRRPGWRAIPTSDGSVHLELFPDDAGAHGATMRWPRNGARCAQVRRVVTGALEIERAAKRIGSSLEAAPRRLRRRSGPVRRAGRRRSRRDLHHFGARRWSKARGPPMRSGCDDVPGVAVVPQLRRGQEMRALLEDLAGGRLRPAISRRHAARRPGAARMGQPCARRRSEPRAYLYGPLTRLGLVVAVIACALDQALEALAAVRLRSGEARRSCRSRRFSTWCWSGTPASATACSSRRARSAAGSCSASRSVGRGRPAVDLAGPGRIAADGAGARPDHRRGASATPSTACAYGAVVDFVLFHITTANCSFNWYVFNLADAAIVAGVAGSCMSPCSGTRRKSALIP